MEERMPLFDYDCPACEKLFEIGVPLEKIEEPIKCPYCGKELTKLPSAPKTIIIR
jgi:putative FmdB family regulatory protein